MKGGMPALRVGMISEALFRLVSLCYEWDVYETDRTKHYDFLVVRGDGMHRVQVKTLWRGASLQGRRAREIGSFNRSITTTKKTQTKAAYPLGSFDVGVVVDSATMRVWWLPWNGERTMCLAGRDGDLICDGHLPQGVHLPVEAEIWNNGHRSEATAWASGN